MVNSIAGAGWGDLTTVLTVVLLAASFWFDKVQEIVPAPYLDEVFHIRQAANYVQGQWLVWDPKITTPPGLYLVSYLQISLLEKFPYVEPVTSEYFRSINVIGSFLLAILVRRVLLLNVEVYDGRHSSPLTNQRCEQCTDWSLADLTHTAINICLFPPLFFFYGLYYTDVLSAVSVLFAYRCFFLHKKNWVLFASLASLLFRQTNIFWVAVYLGGLELCRVLPRGRPDIEFPRQSTFWDVIEGSWQHASVYDPLITEAYFEDYLKTSISLAITTLANLLTVLRNLSSYILILIGFVEFVVWNGGVVLGDKENHVASIHLAQMLYIWPYFMFFSFPLLYPHIPSLNLVSRLKNDQPAASRGRRCPRFVVAVSVVAVMVAIVRYNTIVHPFTLADNRHYMFYVFRLLLRNPVTKYNAVAVYFVCASAAIAALGSPSSAPPVQQPEPQATVRIEPHQGLQTRVPPTLPKPAAGRRTSFVLVWLLATSLSLITAPLVEPRYFIMPWLTWRMHILHPAQKRSTLESTQWPTTFSAAIDLIFDYGLWLETCWFLLINSVTGYIFLYRGFEWPQEPGKVQRFMW